ncbi:MAG: 3D domain-containing protein [Armatimonadota bacterium]
MLLRFIVALLLQLSFCLATFPTPHHPTQQRVVQHRQVKKAQPKVQKKTAHPAAKKRHKKRRVAIARYKMEVTAYCGGRTALGKQAARGTVAVDPKFIPLGTLLHIQGYGRGRAADIGAHMRGKRIDICIPNRQQAKKWGRRKVWVTVYGYR